MVLQKKKKVSRTQDEVNQMFWIGVVVIHEHQYMTTIFTPTLEGSVNTWINLVTYNSDLLSKHFI